MARSTTFAGVELHPDGSLRYRGDWQSTSTCHATVDTVGAIRDRATVTRVVAGAVLAGPVGAVVGGLLRKRVDDRQVWLTITGGEQDWVVEVALGSQKQAQTFAAAVNAAAAQWAARDRRR